MPSHQIWLLCLDLTGYQRKAYNFKWSNRSDRGSHVCFAYMIFTYLLHTCCQRVFCNVNYIISSVMYAFWLVLTYDLLEDRRVDDVILKTFLNSLLYKTNRFQVAVRLFSNRSQRTSKCGKHISDTLDCASCATFLILPHFDVICDLLLNRRTATWDLLVKYIVIGFMGFS